jgi:hypothetical protein
MMGGEERRGRCDNGERIKEEWFIIHYGPFSHLFCLLLRKLIYFLEVAGEA